MGQLYKKAPPEWKKNKRWQSLKDGKEIYEDFSAENYPDNAAWNHVTVHFLPPKPGAEGDFLIEDYFSFPDVMWEKILKKKFFQNEKTLKNLSLNKLPNVKECAKRELRPLLSKLKPEDFEGFRVLLDKIKECVEQF